MLKLLSTLMLLFPLLAQATTSTKEVYEMVNSGKAILVDVREENEVKDGMLKGATWYPLSKIEKDKNWKLAKDKRVFLYCRSGRRSGKVHEMLKAKGIASENIGGYEELKKQATK